MNRSTRLSLVLGAVSLAVGSAQGQMLLPGANNIWVTGSYLGFGISNPNWPVHIRTGRAQGVFVNATATTGVTNSIYSENASSQGRAHFGFAVHPWGQTTALFGKNRSTNGIGVLGQSSRPTGQGIGVRGEAFSPDSVGVQGQANFGVAVDALTRTGVAVRGTATEGGSAGLFDGVVNIVNGALSSTGLNGNTFSVLDRTASGSFVLGAELEGNAAFPQFRFSRSDRSQTVDIGMGVNNTFSVEVSNTEAFAIDQSGRASFGGSPTAGTGVLIQSGEGFPLIVQTLASSSLFYVDGAGNAVSANGGFLTSDERLKSDVVPIEDALEKIAALRGVEFEWREAHPAFGTGTQIGLIAQDVERVLPELVHTADDGMKAVRYENMVAVLVEAIKEQQAILDEQGSVLVAQTLAARATEAENDRLQDRVTSLESRLAAIEAALAGETAVAAKE